MPKPKRQALSRVRERRIEQEIVVDAYTSDERAIGWHCYLDEKLAIPFKAKCIAARAFALHAAKRKPGVMQRPTGILGING